MQPPSQTGQSSPQLIRGVGLGSATALNMIDMIGVGPFITIPLMVSAMGGPQAMLGLDFGRDLRHVRRSGLGGTGRGHAPVGRFLRLSARDLRAESPGPADFFSVRVATFL